MSRLLLKQVGVMRANVEAVVSRVVISTHTSVLATGRLAGHESRLRHYKFHRVSLTLYTKQTSLLGRSAIHQPGALDKPIWAETLLLRVTYR